MFSSILSLLSSPYPATGLPLVYFVFFPSSSKLHEYLKKHYSVARVAGPRRGGKGPKLLILPRRGGKGKIVDLPALHAIVCAYQTFTSRPVFLLSTTLISYCFYQFTNENHRNQRNLRNSCNFGQKTSESCQEF